MSTVVPVVRFKNRYGNDAPVSGALQVLPIQFTNGVTNSVYAQSLDLPAGMKFEIVAIDVEASGLTSDPSLTVGTTKAGTQLVAAVNVTTNLGAVTLKSTTVTSGGILDVRVTNDTGDAFDSVSVNVIGYVSIPPDSLAIRSADHY